MRWRASTVRVFGLLCCLGCLLWFLGFSAGFGQIFGDLSISIQGSSTLPPGTDTIAFGGLGVDASFATGTPPYVRLNTFLSTSPTQQWTYAGGKFKNVGLTTSPGNATGPFLADNGDGTVTANNTGDVWKVTPLPSGGFSLVDTRTNSTMDSVGGTLTMVAPPTTQVIASVTTFTNATNFGTVPNSLVGTVAIPTMNPASPPFPSTGTLSITGNNPCGFHLSSPTPPANVLSGTSGCGVGSYTGWNVAAAAPGFTSFIQPEAATAITISPDGTNILGGQAGQLVTQEGTWTFGAINADGVDYANLLNGGSPPSDGFTSNLQVTNGILYGLNKSQGKWYSRQPNATWALCTTCPPIENGTNRIISVTPTIGTFAAGVAGVVVTEIAALQTGTFNGTWSLQTTGVDNHGTACVNNVVFSIASATGVVSVTSSGLATTYNGVCVVATQTGLTPYVQALTLTGTTSNPCTPLGQGATDAAAAGFGSCALGNDFTTAIPNNVGTGLPSNWLNCNGDTVDTNAVWNRSSTEVVPCSAYTQVTDPTFANLALDINFLTSYVQSGLSFPGSMAQLITTPTVNNSTNTNPAHSFSNAYYEITYRVVPSPAQFTGGTQGMFQFFCCNTGQVFVDNEIFEDWSTWAQNRDFGFNYWIGPGMDIVGAFDHSIPASDPTTYHTIGGMVTSNSTAFSQCMYFDGVRIKCDQGTYRAGQSGAQRRNLTIWNGTSCSFDPRIVTCVGSFTSSQMYIKSVKVVACAAELTGGSCIGTAFNGNFYTP